MLTHPTLEKMKALRLYGMAKAFEEQLQMTDRNDFSFEDRLGLLIDREASDKENRRLQSRLRKAQLAQSACVEDLDSSARRGLDKTFTSKLYTCDWIGEKLNVLITGATGTGKSYLACALGQKACREGYSVEYHRAPRLFPELQLAKGDGRYETILRRLAKTDLVILDDWGLYPMNDEARRDCLELLEDRCGKCSTLVTSQIPLAHWHETIGDPTLADAILDRLVHQAYKVELKGESMRKRTRKLDNESFDGKELTSTSRGNKRPEGLK
jgi:DNA replication protein DnaC